LGESKKGDPAMSSAIISYRFVVSFIVSSAVGFAASASFAQSGYSGSGHSMRGSYAGYSDYGYGYGHASTAAEGYLRGKATVIDSLGNFAVNSSQAAILSEQARSLNLDNNVKLTTTVQAQRKLIDDARFQVRKDFEVRAAEGRRVLADKRATVYRNIYELSTSELDLKTGAINWPTSLRTAKFDSSRNRLEELFREHVSYGGAHAETAREIARTVERLASSLRQDIRSLPREDYMAAQKFLLGLKYGAESVVQS
jgi:hypothetical protein